jgi:hypothetical protein
MVWHLPTFPLKVLSKYESGTIFLGYSIIRIVTKFTIHYTYYYTLNLENFFK